MCHPELVNELVLDGVNGRGVTLSDARVPDADEIWSYRVSLQMPEGHIQAVVWDSGVDLARFLRDLAGAGVASTESRPSEALRGSSPLTAATTAKALSNAS
jgi:hypothetical protein